MDIHYNAFISYRHHPDDIRVATQIHRLLEHYRIPRALREQTKGITRLFRDKEELPITSNLSDDINRALENSDYLIVICSTHTRESTWVQREIETFLKTHDRSKILTVLVNGEPYDTIPEILLYEDVVNPETGETERREIEPLSCDWRMPLRQAKREELPRLAATLLGCGYDELRRRERQYRTRRMVAVFSAAMAATLCFAAYVMHNSLQIQEANDRLEAANGQLASANLQLENANTQLENANAEIQANLNEALINQSQYLASTAEKLMEEGDRVTAMLLALEALPAYDGERPYVAEAEYALANALGAYSSGEELMAAGSFTCDGLVREFRVTSDGAVLYLLDGRNVLTIWDTQSFLRLATIPLEWQPDELLLTPDDNLMLMDTGSMVACYGRDGSLLWSETTDIMDMAILTDTGEVMMITRAWKDGATRYYMQGRNGVTGGETRPEISAETKFCPYFVRTEYHSDMQLAIKAASGNGYNLYALDLATETLSLLASDFYQVYLGGNTADGDVLFLIQKEEGLGYQGRILDMQLSSEENVQLQCFARNSGKLLWETEFVTYQYSSTNTLETIPNSKDILCQMGNLFLLIDSTDGTVKTQSQAMAHVMWVQVNENSTRAVLEDGSVGSFRYSDGICGFYPCAKDELTCVDVYGTDYYVADYLSNQVIVYRYITDTNKMPLGENEFSYPTEWHNFDNYVALEQYGKLQMVDLTADKLLWTLNISSGEILGFSEDGAHLWVSTGGTKLLKVDTVTGEITELQLGVMVEGISSYTEQTEMLETSVVDDEICIRDGYIYYLTRYRAGDRLYLLRQDLTTGSYDFRELYSWDDRYSDYYYGRLVAAENGYALVWNLTDNTLLEMEFESGESRILATGIVGMPAYQSLAEGNTYLLGIGDKLMLRSWGGEAQWETTIQETRPVSVYTHLDMILALCDDGYLYRFDMAGNPMGRTGMTRYTTFDSAVTQVYYEYRSVSWTATTDGDLLLNINGAGNLVDGETWKGRMFLEYCYAYSAERNVLMLKDAENENGMCIFPLYSTEDIVSMAMDALNGAELTEDQRAAYGLD